MIEALALGFEFLRRGGVELEHVKVVGNHQPGTDFAGQDGGLMPVEIAGDAASGRFPLMGSRATSPARVFRRRSMSCPLKARN